MIHFLLKNYKLTKENNFFGRFDFKIFILKYKLLFLVIICWRINRKYLQIQNGFRFNRTAIKVNPLKEYFEIEN